MSKRSLKVVPLRETPINDIAAQFRKMADEIDAGEHGHMESMVVCAEIDGVVQIYGWGNIDGMRAIAMFNLASAKLTGETLRITGSVDG